MCGSSAVHTSAAPFGDTVIGVCFPIALDTGAL